MFLLNKRINLHLVKTILLLFIVSILSIQIVGAQDFVQPIKRTPVRIKKNKEEQKDTKRSRVEIKELDYQHFKLSVNAGYSDHTYRWVEKIPTPLTPYVKDLKSGSHFGFDFIHYTLEPVGFGIKYTGYSGKAAKAISNTSFGASTTDQDLSVRFIGPEISIRYLHADLKNTVFFNMAYGYAAYRVNYQSDTKFMAKGSTMATVYDLGYDIGLNQNISLGFQISYLRGFLTEYDSTNEGRTQKVYLERGKYERLHRLDFSIGLKLNL